MTLCLDSSLTSKPESYQKSEQPTNIKSLMITINIECSRNFCLHFNTKQPWSEELTGLLGPEGLSSTAIFWPESPWSRSQSRHCLGEDLLCSTVWSRKHRPISWPSSNFRRSACSAKRRMFWNENLCLHFNLIVANSSAAWKQMARARYCHL